MTVIIAEGLARTFQFDSSGSPLLYTGEAAVGSLASEAVWRISRIDVTVGVVILYADGNSEYDNVWANRATLNYL